LGHAQQAFVNLESPSGDTFHRRKHLQRPAPTFSAKSAEEQHGFEATKEGRAGEAGGEERAHEQEKRRTSSRRRK